jgi:hypothetical protein
VKGDAFALGLGRRVAKPEIANRPQAAWQDVAKVSLHELRAFERLDTLGIAPRKRRRRIADRPPSPEA